MKYYETNYDEYLSSHETYSLHPELEELKSTFPKHISDFKNLIIYGSPGVGKYTQALTILQKYSPTKLKYDKKISVTYEKQEKKTKTSTTTSKVVSSNLHTGEETGGSNIINTTSNTKKKKTETGEGTMTSILQMKKVDKKQEYTYRISDIHYEIDMATLGCNSKLLWHDLFFQIVDIISVSLNPSILHNEHKNKKEECLLFSQENKTLRENSSTNNKIDKIGIILCKNFHAIHNELLDIFYSYIRHPLHHFNIQIKFILLTEHVGFIPDNIMNACQCISVKRPSKERYLEMVKIHQKPFSYFSESLGNTNSMVLYDKVTRTAVFPKKKTAEILEEIDLNTIMNIKEIYSFSSLKSLQEIPTDVFNMITDALLEQILHPENLKITELRNHLYELLIYNVDISECIWHIFISLIKYGSFSTKKHITEMLNEIFVFFKYYNNNYRSIYHLESIMLCMLNKIHYSSKHVDVHKKCHESLESGSNPRIK
jgi:adenylate kinase family enzyme